MIQHGSILPRSKYSVFPVHRSAHFGALHWYASLEAQCTSFSSAFSLQCSVYCTYTAMQQCSCSICTSEVVQCIEVLDCTGTANALHFDLGGHAMRWPNEYHICKEKIIPLWYQMGVPRLNQQPLKKGNSISIIGILGNGILMNSTTQWDSNPGP